MKRHFIIYQLFTMVETLIALAVLLLALSAVFTTVATSQQRMIRAERKWKKEHLLTQAAEFYLLAPPDAPIPPALFPYHNYQVSAEYAMPLLPTGVQATNGNWQLVKMTVTLRNSADNKIIDTIELERIVSTGD